MSEDDRVALVVEGLKDLTLELSVPILVDLEFQKVFAQARFDPDGGRVEEELIDERIFVE